VTLFIQNDATGAGAGNLDPNQAAVDLGIIANGDTGLGLAAQVGNRQQVTFARTDPGVPANRLDTLVNTNFTVDYGLGAGQQAVPIVIVPALANFTLNDGTMITTVAGIALPPSNSGLPGATLNTTTDCLAVYDTSQNSGAGYCVARAGTSGTLDLGIPNAVLLYHELSHAFREVTNALNALTAGCNPSSPEENAAIVDENDVRTQSANAAGTTPVLRDPGIHCGNGGPCGTSCCIIASVATGSPLSQEVADLRRVRDGLLRKSEIGYAFFESLHHDYYAFSPQVCTLLARDPNLRPLVVDGLVRPLVVILGLIEAFSLEHIDAAELGERFVSAHDDRASADERLGIMTKARQVVGGNDEGLTERQRQLAELISPALHSDHLLWAVVEPIQIYESALWSCLDGVQADAIGRQLVAALDEWGPRMPVDRVWAALSTAGVREELDLLEETLLRTPDAKARFRARLKSTHGAASAIAALGEPGSTRGGT
jgi:hypothetical protein